MSKNLFKIKLTRENGELKYKPEPVPLVTEPAKAVAERLKSRTRDDDGEVSPRAQDRPGCLTWSPRGKRHAFGSTLNRMIFWELVKVFLLSLGTLTGLFLIVPVCPAGVGSWVCRWRRSSRRSRCSSRARCRTRSRRRRCSPRASCTAGCRHDNEVVAIKAAGVHLFSILQPALLLGVITTAVTAGLYHTIIPRRSSCSTRSCSRTRRRCSTTRSAATAACATPTCPYVIYVRDVQGKRLIDVVLKRRMKVKDPRDGDGSLRRLRLRRPHARGPAARRSGRRRALPSTPTGRPLRQEHVRGDDRANRAVRDGLAGRAQRQGQDPQLGADLGRPAGATRVACADELAEVGAERGKMRRTAESDPHLQDPHAAQLEDRIYKFQVDTLERTIRNVGGGVLPAAGAGGGVPALRTIGCPVGIWANRADYLSTFVICFLPALFIYYPLQFAGGGLSRDGKVPLWFGYWMANIAIGVIAVMLNWRLMRR